MKRSQALVIALLSITALSAAVYAAEDTVLRQIGKPDNSYATSASPPEAVGSVALTPTFLFRKAKGKLQQVACASVKLTTPQEKVRVEIQGDGWRVSREFRNVPAGRSDLEVEIPELVRPQEAELTVTTGGKQYNAKGVLSPQKHWRIYILPTSHLDIGYTDQQDAVLRLHCANIERAVNWCKRYPDFRWAMEGSIEAQEQINTSKRLDEFIPLLRENRLGAMGFYANELTGICSGEELTRLIDYYDILRKDYGAESKCATLTDIPSMVSTIPMILAGHGIKYLSHGINRHRAYPKQENYNTPYYWESPDGSRVLVWKTVGYGQSRSIFGRAGDNTLEQASKLTNRYLSQYAARTDYPYDAVLMHGSYGDNIPNRVSLASISDQWNRKYEYPKLILSSGPQFFEYIESRFAKEIRTVKGDGGIWWEDGAASSAKETASVRNAKEKLVTAEKIAVHCGPEFQRATADQFAQAWRNVLVYDEHTWGASGSVTHPDAKQTRRQWAIKKRFADQADKGAEELLDRSLSELAARVNPSEDSILVFNPSGFERSGPVSCEAPGSGSVGLVSPPVPPLGYAVIPANKAFKAESRLEEGDTLENRFYRIRFDGSTGAVTSLFDKELQRELIDPTGFKANQFLYAAGGENSLLMWARRPKPEIKLGTCSKASLEKRVMTGRQMMVSRSAAPMSESFASEVILYNDRKRVDFINHLEKSPTLSKEAGYFAFPFAMKNPEVRIEIPDGVIRPETDMIPGGCRDWFGVQDFVTLSDGSATVVWTPQDSPLVTLQDINRGQWATSLRIENGAVFAYVFNNYWRTNYKASQGGSLTFRFSLTSAKSLTDAQAKRFGEEARVPLVAKWIKGTGRSKVPSPSPYVDVEGEDILLQAVKPARFTHGIVIRLREMGGKTSNVRIRPEGFSFRKAYLCNLAEDKLQELSVRDRVVEVPCRSLGLTTVLLE